MRCFYCHKHEAVKLHEGVEQGKLKREYYCLACYEKLFLNAEPLELSACPYCGATVQEFESSKLVGCPYCYKMLHGSILPAVLRMQGGDCTHRGKAPAISEKSEALLESERLLTPALKSALRARLLKEDRFHKQLSEMNMLAEYLKIHDPEREKEYREKLERMRKTGAIEEEIIW